MQDGRKEGNMWDDMEGREYLRTFLREVREPIER